jgi:ketosteroid isomerase-like protein
MASAVDDRPGDEAEIRGLIDGWLSALRAKDVDGRTSSYAEDVVIYDVVDPLRRVGLEELKGRLAEWFSTFQGPVSCEIRDLEIAVSGDVAFFFGLNRFSGTTVRGALDMWVRSTTCLRKIESRWMVVLEHTSVPFDGGTGKASTDLKP